MKLLKKGLSLLLILTMMLLPITGMATTDLQTDYVHGELTYAKPLLAFLEGRKIDTNVTYNIDNIDLSQLISAGLIDEKSTALVDAIMLTLSTISYQLDAALVDDGLSAGFGVTMQGENIFDADFNVNSKEIKFMTSVMPNKLFVYYLDDVLTQIQAMFTESINIENKDLFVSDEIQRYGAVLYGFLLSLDEPTEITTNISPFGKETSVTVTSMLITQEKLKDLLVTLTNALAQDPYFKDIQVNNEQTLSAMLYEAMPDLMKAELADLEISYHSDKTGNLVGGMVKIGEITAQANILEDGKTTQANIRIGGTDNYMDIVLEKVEGEEATQASFNIINAINIDDAKLTQTTSSDMEITGDNTQEQADLTIKVNQVQEVEGLVAEINAAGTNHVVTTVQGEDFTQTQKPQYNMDMTFNEMKVAFGASADVNVSSSKATSFAVGEEFEMITLNTLDETTTAKLGKEMQSNIMSLSFKVMSLLPNELMSAISELEKTKENLPPEVTVTDEVLIESVE